MTTDLDHIAANFRKRRLALGLSLRQVADLTGGTVTHATVANAEKDAAGMLVTTAQAISAALQAAEAARAESEGE